MQQAVWKQNVFRIKLKKNPTIYLESLDVLTECIECGHLKKSKSMEYFWHVIITIPAYQEDVE